MGFWLLGSAWDLVSCQFRIARTRRRGLGRGFIPSRSQECLKTSLIEFQALADPIPKDLQVRVRLPPDAGLRAVTHPDARASRKPLHADGPSAPMESAP